MGGVLGNFTDRMLYEGVIDFIGIKLTKLHPLLRKYLKCTSEGSQYKWSM